MISSHADITSHLCQLRVMRPRSDAIPAVFTGLLCLSRWHQRTFTSLKRVSQPRLSVWQEWAKVGVEGPSERFENGRRCSAFSFLIQAVTKLFLCFINASSPLSLLLLFVYQWQDKAYCHCKPKVNGLEIRKTDPRPGGLCMGPHHNCERDVGKSRARKRILTIHQIPLRVLANRMG